MEIVQNTLKVMDTSRITIVRSCKDNKMLIVDDFLYQYEDREVNTYRWVCSKRKEENCRAQLITAPVVGDDTRHVVVRINADHSHKEWTKSELDKAMKTKKPSVEEVEVKFEPKSNIKREHERQQEQESITSDDEGEDYDMNDDDPEYVEEEDDNEDEDDDDDEDDDNDEYSEEQEYAVTKRTDKKAAYKRKDESSSLSFKTLSEFKHNKVYILRTHHNRDLVLVNGFLYRLEGKSKTSATFRWECIRSDINCKTRIYTERHSNTRHSFKQLTGVRVVHDHQPYTPIKLSQLIEKHKITVIQDEPTTKKIKEQPNYATQLPHYATSPSTDPLTSRKRSNVNEKITLLPSGKGNRLICAGKMMYFFDSKSPCSRRTYWTCYYRHHKKYKCMARIITEETSEGPILRKMSGEHTHGDHTAEIKRRQSILRKEKNPLSSSTPLVKQSHKPVRKSTTKASNMSGYNSSTSCSSLSSDAPNLPTKLEDMRQRQSIKDSKKIVLASPEHIEFVDSIECEFLENEHSYDALSETNVEEHNSISTPVRQSSRKRKVPLQQSYIVKNEADEEYSNSKIPIKREWQSKLVLQEESDDDLIHTDIELQETNLVMSKKRARKSKVPPKEQKEYEMDITKVSQLRSAKGGILLCVDGYIYHMKSEATRKNYWICIKNRDYSIKCKSFVTTSRGSGDIKVVHVTNKHNHPVNENDIKRRLCNELTANGAIPKNISKANYFLSRTLEEVKADCAAILSLKQETLDPDQKSKMKLYAVSDGPPSLAVRMTFNALSIPFELVNVDYIAAEHMTESYAKMNPQKEIPVLDDDGFYLSESIAIMQYLCDKYAPDSKLYPTDPKARALVNHRLCFNMGFYYSSISMHSMAPIFFDYPRNEMTLKKVKNALSVFETYLKRSETKYAAADHVTIADFALVASTLCLEAIGFDLSPYPLVKSWYMTFKTENPQIWEIGLGGMQEIAEFEKNPPDLSHMNHPFHPTRKTTS